jgi:hypothetical protein
MYQCPKCSSHFRLHQTHKCPSCQSTLVYCAHCDHHSELCWRAVRDRPQVAAYCGICSRIIPGTNHVRKSSIYQHFRYAFKFVNEVHVPYPMYFDGSFPFGAIDEDFGDYVNDFVFADEANEPWARMMGTDWGTARAYRMRFQTNETDPAVSCVALSHETGLEVFLLAAGAFVGVEVAKFSLKVVLESIQKSINEWWKSRRSEHWKREHSALERLTEKISVRTPYWEITLDGQFTPEERDRIFDHIGRSMTPGEEIEQFVAEISDRRLARKVIASTRRIIRRA